MTEAEMIEAAARAIFEVVINRSKRSRGWDQVAEGRREDHRREARAALEAAGALNPSLARA